MKKMQCVIYQKNITTQNIIYLEIIRLNILLNILYNDFLII